MRKIVITGATSMIGVALTEVAIKENIEVYSIVRPNTTRTDRIIRSPLIHLVNGSLDKLLDITELPADCDTFYHFAWAGTSREERDDARIHEKNIKYTLDAVELAKRAGCKRFIGAGSQAEYGPVDGVIDDDTSFKPVISYGIAKYASGILSRKLCEENGMNHVWGRIFSVYGPHDNDWTMLKQAITGFKNGEVVKFSSGTQSWNYLYASDAGEIFYRLGDESVPAGTYLVANSESRPLREYIEIMMNVYGDGAKAEFAPKESVKTAGLDVDAKRTFDVIKYEPKIGFDKGMKKIIEYSRS